MDLHLGFSAPVESASHDSVARAPAVGILLPRGFAEEEVNAESEAAAHTVKAADLLASVPPEHQARLNAACVAAETRADVFDVFVRFEWLLGSIALPRTFTGVSMEQAWKDVRREQLLLNGRSVEGAEALHAALEPLLQAFTFDSEARGSLALDLLRAASRTSSGGDAYFVVASLLAKPGVACTASADRDPGPVSITITPKGEAVIITRSCFELKRLPSMDDDDEDDEDDELGGGGWRDEVDEDGRRVWSLPPWVGGADAAH